MATLMIQYNRKLLFRFVYLVNGHGDHQFFFHETFSKKIYGTMPNFCNVGKQHFFGTTKKNDITEFFNDFPIHD